MSATAILTPETTPTKIVGDKPRAHVSQRRIAMRIDVDANKRRIYDALTIPEYIEAWLSLPGNHTGGRTMASQADKTFRFDHYTHDRLDLSITGSYRACRRGRMFFSWRKSSAFNESRLAPESLVQIRLYGAFTKSILCLSHTGFCSDTEFRWHSEMWNRSLKKLQSLFPPRN
jgi:uncharacterized protein YndB with AHSA1/START domain